MRLSIPQKPFSAVLAKIQNIAAGRSTMPILSTVLLEPATGVMAVTATDLEVGYTTVVDNLIWLDDTPQLGEFPRLALNAKKLHECVKAIPVSMVDFSIDEASCRVTISGGTASFTLPGLDPEEFPALPDFTGENFDLDAAALLDIIGHVAYCQSKAPEKYNLNGCFLKIEANQDDELFLTAVATDGHRLAIDNTPLPGDPRPVPVDLAKGVIVPSKGISEIRKISREGIIVLSIAANNLQISTADEKLFLRLVDGAFPDCEKVIPRNLPGRAEVKRLALIDALERCRILSEKDSHKTRLGFAEGSIALNAEDILSGGQAADCVTAGVYCEPFDLYVNADYLIETLENMDCGIVELGLGDGLQPLTVNPLGTDEPMAVIMPQRS